MFIVLFMFIVELMLLLIVIFMSLFYCLKINNLFQFVSFYQKVERVLRTLLILFDGREHRQNQTGEHQEEPEEERTG